MTKKTIAFAEFILADWDKSYLLLNDAINSPLIVADCRTERQAIKYRDYLNSILTNGVPTK